MPFSARSATNFNRKNAASGNEFVGSFRPMELLSIATVAARSRLKFLM
jgi:hypothetical protein